MGPPFGLFLALFAIVWLFLAARGSAREFRRANRFKWTVAVMYFLILVGASGFFAAALSANGVLKLPFYREWPAGYVGGVVTTVDGKYIVPLVPSGRVQLYDPHWQFIRGWNVAAEGGDFKTQHSPNDLIEVFTARGEHHYSFDEYGHLIASMRVPPEYFSSLPKSESVVVPTSLFLWPFSSPFLSWGVTVIGFVGLSILRKIGRRATV
jgi:hypothetical protein